MPEQRGIKVILFSDVVDSSGRMFDDEASTVALIERDLSLFARQLERTGGSLIKNTGDGILATFDSTVAALGFLQGALRELRQQSGPALQHRFGLHIAEIYLKGDELKGDDILGQGVHLAARLQGISPVNGVAFTEATGANLDPRFRDWAVSLGAIELKGLPGRIPCQALPEAVLLRDLTSEAPSPLRSRWRRLQGRLRGTTRAQGLAAAALLSLGLAVDLDPAQPLSTYLLDRRLLIQKLWRQRTAQPGPQRPAPPVLLLDSPEEVLPRATLSRLLEQLPPDRYPAVALDLVLDTPGPDPAATARLAELIRRQGRRVLYVGYFDAQASAVGAGDRSRPLPELLAAGVQPRDLTISTAAGSGPLKAPPLQLLAPITARHLSAVVPGAGAVSMPADAVIDWSLDWERMLQLAAPGQLTTGSAPLLLVGRIGDLRTPDADLFQTPAAVLQEQPLWRGNAREMPGVLVQAVIGQSRALRHWLTPVSSLVVVALAAGAGVLLAALVPRRGRRLVLLLLSIPAGGILALQLGVSAQLLIPIALPTLALTTTALLRRA